MTVPPNSLVTEAIARDECLRLLASASLARVVISVKCLPVALPARMSLSKDGFALLASTDPSVAFAAERSDVISIQIDGLDDEGLTWSVMASGIARLAGSEQTLDPILQQARNRGATLVTLPLSVVVGQRG